jgi:hypothetical protein
MTKLRKNFSVCSRGVHVQAPENQGVPVPGWPISNLHGDDRSLIYVGGISVTPNPIRFDTAENIIQAAGYAQTIDCPLDYHLTIKWLLEHVTPAQARDYHHILIQKIGEWQKNNFRARIFVWGREAKGGPHSHILLHCPRDKKPKLAKMVTKWLKLMLGLRGLPKGTKQFTQLWKGEPFDNIRNRVRYILKGADADTRHVLGCRKSEAPYIEGKRAGVYQDLNTKARRLAGSVTPSGARKPTLAMIEAGDIGKRCREEQAAAPFQQHFRQGSAA